MEPIDIAHLAGLLDGSGQITVSVAKNDRYSIGYQFKPMIRIYRSEDDEATLGKLDVYCDDNDVQYTLKENENRESSSLVFVVYQPDSIERFLEPLLPVLVTKHYEATLMLGEVLPAIRDGRHKTKEGFYDLMPVADEIRSTARKGRDSKYTQEYFTAEWGDDLEAVTA